MGQFYIDDSLHDSAGFIIGACVYSEINLDEKINDIIKLCGFNPEVFEYKSNQNYSKEPEKAKVREHLKELLIDNCKLGVVVLPRSNREQLGFECIKAVKQFIESNVSIKKPIEVFIDQGMFSSTE